MKAGFLLDSGDKNDTSSPVSCDKKTKNGNELGPLRDKRSLRVKYLWSGPAETVRSKPVSWGWNTSASSSTACAPGWTPKDPNEEAHGSKIESDSLKKTSGSAYNKDPNPGSAFLSEIKNSSGDINPYKNVPLLPHKTLGVPKNALSSWSGKRHKGKTIKNEHFQTWNDGGVPHLLKWTSLFTCPITGEKFASGRYGDDKFYGSDISSSETKTPNISSDSTSNTKAELSSEKEHMSDDKDKMDTTDSTAAEKGKTNAPNKANAIETTNGVVWYSKKILAEHAAAARALDCLALREDKILGGSGVKVLRICVEEPYLATDEIALKQIGNAKSKLAMMSGKAADMKKKRAYEGNNDKFRNNYRNQRRPHNPFPFNRNPLNTNNFPNIANNNSVIRMKHDNYGTPYNQYSSQLNVVQSVYGYHSTQTHTNHFISNRNSNFNLNGPYGTNSNLNEGLTTNGNNSNHISLPYQHDMTNTAGSRLEPNPGQPPQPPQPPQHQLDTHHSQYQSYNGGHHSAYRTGGRWDPQNAQQQHKHYY